MALAWRYVPSSAGHGRLSQMPYVRLILLAGSVFALAVTSRADDPIERVILLGGAFICAVIAFRRDARAERPMFPRQVTAIRTEIGAAYWILLIFSVVVASVNVYSALFLQRLHGLSPALAGYLFAVPSLIWTLGSIVVAPLHGWRQTVAIVTGLILIAVGVAGIFFTVTTGPVWLITVFMGTLGLGVGSMNNPTIQRAIEAAPASEKHIAGTSVQTMRTLGVSFGAACSGLIAVAAGLTTDDVPTPVLGHAMHWVYGVAIGFAVLNVAMAVPMLLGRKKRLAALAQGTAATQN
jgi:predicted MFS family arabinose efflux permease